MKLLLTLICSFVLLFPVAGQSPVIEKEPSWITRNNIDYTAPVSTNDIDDGCLDLALENQVNLSPRESYWKRSLKIITEAGIQNRSEVSVSYDPAYQHMAFHYIRIKRGDEVINKLNISKVKIIHQETELSRSIYNGALTAVVFLEDVRKGDVIEYAYTIKGSNPVFNNKYFDVLETQYSVPVRQLYYKIICPANRNLYIKNKLTDIVPVNATTASGKTYEWKLNNVPALKAQDALPEWYDPYPTVMVSEYATWKEVNDWALPLFKIKDPLSNGLKKKIEEIRANNSDPEKQVLAALRFVQDDVRYLGIEIGSNTHKPYNPNKIFENRFGDCKDKSFLLCTMLNALGIEASPVLINSVYGNVINEWLPSPLAFNHATVRTKLNGKTYFFDATISFQRGYLKDISFPDYKRGLVLTDSTTELTVIPLQETGCVSTKEVFTMEKVNGPANLVVTTHYSGSFADDMRSEINNNSLNDLQKNFLDFYNQYYDETKQRDSLKIEEDEENGTVTTHEFYTVDKLWTDKNDVQKAEFFGVLINTVLKKPKDHDRKMPLGISHPSHYIEEIEVHLPEPWDFDKTPAHIKSDAFEFNSNISSNGNTLVLKYEYKALQDHVKSDDAASFMEDYEKLQSDISYELTKKGSGNYMGKENQSVSSSAANTGSNILKTLVLIVVVTVIIVLIKQRSY